MEFNQQIRLLACQIPGLTRGVAELISWRGVEKKRFPAYGLLWERLRLVAPPMWRADAAYLDAWLRFRIRAVLVRHKDVQGQPGWAEVRPFRSRGQRWTRTALDA